MPEPDDGGGDGEEREDGAQEDADLPLQLRVLVPLLLALGRLLLRAQSTLVLLNHPSVSQSVFTIAEKAPTRTFSLLKVPASTFTFKTLLRHINVKVCCQCKDHKGQVLFRH